MKLLTIAQFKKFLSDNPNISDDTPIYAKDYVDDTIVFPLYTIKIDKDENLNSIITVETI